MNFRNLFFNDIFIASFSSYFLSQLVKIIIHLFSKNHNKTGLGYLSFFGKTGGMPSSHSSTITALTVSIGFVEGMASPLFIAMVFVAAVIIRDALGVRLAVGEQAKTINKLGAELAEKIGVSHHPVKEIHGHTLLEVIVGIIIGFLMAVLFYLI